jgi:hypothetical protein
MVVICLAELLINIIPSRPSTIKARIPPSELRDHRTSHQMLGPCCFCPLAYPKGPDYVEAAIYEVLRGSLLGEYVASCARGKCDYFGMLSKIFMRD